MPAGGVFYRAAALLCAHHLPGQGPHAPRSHQRPGVHVHAQGTGWGEGDLRSSRMGGKGGRPREVGGGGVDYLRALGHLLSQADPKPCSFWDTESLVRPPSSSSAPPPPPRVTATPAPHLASRPPLAPHTLLAVYGFSTQPPLSLPHTCPHPFPYRGESTPRRVFCDPSLAPPPPLPDAPQPTLISRQRVGGGTIAFGTSSFGKSGAWKQDGCGSPPRPCKCPPHSK